MGTYNVKWYAQKKIEELMMAPLRKALGFQGLEFVQTNVHQTPLKVVCVGFGRTGTVRRIESIHEYPTLRLE